MADGIQSVVDAVAPKTTTLAIGAEIPGEQFAALAAAMFKLGDDIFNVLNTPAMLVMRQRQDIQAVLNQMDSDLAQAQKTGDVTQVDRDSSG